MQEVELQVQRKQKLQIYVKQVRVMRLESATYRKLILLVLLLHQLRVERQSIMQYWKHIFNFSLELKRFKRFLPYHKLNKGNSLILYSSGNVTPLVSLTLIEE